MDSEYFRRRGWGGGLGGFVLAAAGSERVCRERGRGFIFWVEIRAGADQIGDLRKEKPGEGEREVLSRFHPAGR